MALVRTIAGIPVITFSILRFILLFLQFTSLCKRFVIEKAVGEEGTEKTGDGALDLIPDEVKLLSHE
jgi:hypothetical protein